MKSMSMYVNLLELKSSVEDKVKILTVKPFFSHYLACAHFVQTDLSPSPCVYFSSVRFILLLRSTKERYFQLAALRAIRLREMIHRDYTTPTSFHSTRSPEKTLIYFHASFSNRARRY